MNISEKYTFGYIELFEKELEEEGMKFICFELKKIEKFGEISYLVISRGSENEGVILYAFEIDEVFKERRIDVISEEGLKETMLYLMLDNQINWILVDPSLCINDEICLLLQKNLNAKKIEIGETKFLYSQYNDDEFLISNIGSSYIE